MPRIIEAKIGKVAGPLRMKVIPTASSTRSTTHTPNSEGRNHSPSLSSEQEIRRGRYFRRTVNGSKKSRSKSFPSTNQTAFLFGKPPDDDDSLQDFSIDYPIKSKKSNINKDEDLRSATSQASVVAKTGTPAVKRFDPSDLTHFDDNHRPSIPFVEPSQHRYALAIDTRCLETSARTGRGSESHSVAESIIRNCKVLTQSLHSRGLTPCIVTSTVASDKARSSLHYTHENKRVAAALADLGLGIETHKLFHGDSKDSEKLKKAINIDDDTWYTQVEIPTAKLNTGVLSIPLPLNATYSWLLFSAMVDAIIAEDTKLAGFVSSNALKASKCPIKVAIICSDDSLFCDTNVDSHRTGLQVFIDHVTPYFRRGLLSSIAITTAVTKGQLALSLEENGKHPNQNLIPEKPPESIDSELLENHQVAMQECVRMIEWELDDTMAGIHSSHDDVRESSVCCSFTLIKNSIVDFMALSHSMVRTALVASNTRLACQLRRIDLPVSGDGTHCSISLEACYEMFPFMVHSYHGMFLSSDLDDLSLMHLEVVQSMPLSMIDVSLLFGIPLVVRAALDKDYAQYQDMKMLVRSFFTVLQKQELAILLRGTAQLRLSSESANEHIHEGFSFPSEQYFLLMAQETPTTIINTESCSVGPSSGLLFRIAHFDYLLHDKYMVDSAHGQCIPTAGDIETDIQYMEYIENSLSTLSVDTYNPFTICLPNDERRYKTNVHETLGMDKGDIQNASCALNTDEARLPISCAVDTSFPIVSNEMDISYEAAKLSIYDLHAVSDDMSQ